MSAPSPPLAERAFALAGAAALVALVWHHMTILGDGFWYIATGRLLLEHHAVPSIDPFSFASRADAWQVVSAGSTAIFAWTSDHFGLVALLALATAVEGAAALTVWLANARSLSARLLLLPLAFLFVQVDAEDLSARGQLFGDLAFVLLLLLLTRLRRGERMNPLWPLLLGAGWVNLHPSFLLAAVVPVLMAGGLLLDAPEARQPVRPFVVFAALSLAGSLLNPYGSHYVPFVLRLTLDPSSATFDLFQSPNFQDPLWLVAPAVAVVLAGVRTTRGGDQRRCDYLLLAAFLLAACVSRRYVTQLLAVEITILGSLAPSLPRIELRPAILASLAVPLLAAAGLWIAEPNDPLANVPAESARFVHDRHPVGNVMNPLHWGGYLAYAWRGDPRYFVDGRDQVVLFGNGVADDAAELWRGGSHWREILDAYQIDTVLWERGSPLDALLAQDPAWTKAHEDWLAVVYVRRQPV